MIKQDRLFIIITDSFLVLLCWGLFYFAISAVRSEFDEPRPTTEQVHNIPVT